MNTDQLIRYACDLASGPQRAGLFLDLANVEAELEARARRLADSIDTAVAQRRYEWASHAAADLMDLVRALRLVNKRQLNRAA